MKARQRPGAFLLRHGRVYTKGRSRWTQAHFRWLGAQRFEQPAQQLVFPEYIGAVTQDGAILFFQLINARHERVSTVLTSNKGFEDWGSVLGDEVMAAALIDRLLHHCQIVNIRGNSYRMRHHQDLLRAGRPDPDEDTHRSPAS